MEHAQKPDFVFPRNGRVHLNRWGRQFSRLLATEVRASAWVMLDTPRSEMAWEYWLPTPFASFPFISPPVRHRVPPGSERALQIAAVLLTVCISALAHLYALFVKSAVSPHASTRRPLDGFSWNFILETFLILCWENQNLIKIGPKNRPIYMKT